MLNWFIESLFLLPVIEKIFGLQVPMNYPFTMHVGHCRQHLLNKICCIFLGIWPLLHDTVKQLAARHTEKRSDNIWSGDENKIEKTIKMPETNCNKIRKIY